MTLGSVTGSGLFAPLHDGQDVPLVEGGQGGFHVWMKFRVEGVAAGRYRTVRRAHRLSDDAVVLRSNGVVDVGAPDERGAWELPVAAPMFMCPTPIGVAVDGQPIVYETVLTTDDNREVARGQITLVPHCPVENHDFCVKICSG